jgi:acetyl-CoA carboxylase biotin carboxylase subunit
MQRALEAMIIEGVETSVSVHQQVLADPDFIAGNLSTKFMDRFAPKKNAQPSEPQPEAESVGGATQ